MKMIIDGKTVEAAEGSTILSAAEENGIRIPSLCYLKEINCISVCRICVVEVAGEKKLVPACSTRAREGMVVNTCGERVRRARRKTLELICSDHNMDCTECPRGADCELRELCREYEVDDRAYGVGKRCNAVDDSTPYLVRDNGRCILCRRCESICAKAQGIRAIAANRRGGETNIGFGLPLSETDCVGCGQCVAACPTGALTQRDDTKKVWKALFDKDRYVVAAVSPYAYCRIGELFGQATGTDCGGKVAAMLRKMGFDRVYDPGCGEIGRLVRAAEGRKPGDGPALSGDCPAWRRYLERFYPRLLGNILPVPSRAEELALRCKEAMRDKNVFFVSIENCVASKGCSGGVDAAVSTRELFAMIRRACVSSFTARTVWDGLKGEAFDSLPGACGTAGPELRNGLCEKTEQGLRVAVATGLANGNALLESGEPYDLIYVYACPGGCLNGGGMPRLRDGPCKNAVEGMVCYLPERSLCQACVYKK